MLLANPRGFCAGVERAIDIVERALLLYGPPVYVRHEIVHNARVVDELRRKGAVFVEELDEVPAGARTIFSAHGVARSVEDQARSQALQVIDATCPLVAKVHRQGSRYADRGYSLILIGHRGHPEVVGTVGQINGPVHIVGSVAEAEDVVIETPEHVAYVTQTTLSVTDTRDIIRALRRRFPSIKGPDTRDICYATQNRQSAVLDLARHVDRIVVVGANNSSNSNRLRELGEKVGIPSLLLNDADSLDPAWLADCNTLGLTAGASAPESIVQDVIARISEFRDVDVSTLDGIAETTTFKLPPELLAADHETVGVPV